MRRGIAEALQQSVCVCVSFTDFGACVVMLQSKHQSECFIGLKKPPQIFEVVSVSMTL